MNSVWLFNLGAQVYAWFTAQAAWRASCARLAEPLDGLEPGWVADLGCGPGVSTFALAERLPQAHLVGIDLAPRMLGEARRRDARQREARRPEAGPREARHHEDRRRAAACRHPIRWLRADAARLPIADASLAACTGHSFLYLVDNRRAVLAEVYRVLRPGGRLVLMEPHVEPATPGRVLAVSRDVRHLVSVGLWRPFSRLHGRFSAGSLRQTLASAGFVDCQVESTLNGLGLLATARRPP